LTNQEQQNYVYFCYDFIFSLPSLQYFSTTDIVVVFPKLDLSL